MAQNSTKITRRSGSVLDGTQQHSVEPGEENSTATPLRVPGIPRIVAIAAGEDISAAVDSDGHVWMWGQGHPSPTSPTL
ncbi:hypothetical protein [Rhodanobacter terrae]|uniref:Regulator of chromosome condensation (RCC1) repeat-containing protein n=1 Tax=Rhodanobacter terrae TaxID=418647 RepID=A0ABW0T1M0_9GAMM